MTISIEEERRLLDHINDTGNPHLRPKLWVEGSATLDFANMAANGMDVQALTVTGAVVGAPVIIGAPSTIEAGLTWCGFVSAADTVTVRVHNNSGGALNPAAAVWKACVLI